MRTEFKIINPHSFEQWDNSILLFDEASFFHSSSWARVLSDSYHFLPMYCSLFENGSLSAAIPLMEVKDLIGRKKGVSLPFSDFCQPLFSSQAVFEKLYKQVVETARINKWNSIAIRGDAPFPTGTTVSDCYYRHILILMRSDEALFKTFRKNTQRNIRKAIRSNIRISFESSAEAVQKFYYLNCRTRKNHGLPPQPRLFFTNLYNLIIKKGLGEVALAYKNDTVVSAAVFLFFGTVASYKYGASDEQTKKNCPAYLLMWEAIRRYNASSYQTFCFGRTEKIHTGLLQFKTGWGTVQVPIKNYTYKVRKDVFVQAPLRTKGIHNTFFRLMPMPVLKTLGRIMYRYMG